MFNFVEELPSARPAHVFKVGGIAALLVLSALAAYVLLNPLPPAPSGEVLDITPYAAPPITMGADGGVVLASTSQPSQPGRTLLVLTPVKIQNPTDQPFSIFDLTGVVRLGNAEYHSSTVSAEDFLKVFHYYPDLVSYQQPPLLRHSEIEPGATLQGLLVFNYPLTQEQWERRSSFAVSVSFDHGRDIQPLETEVADIGSQLSAAAR